MQKTILLIEDTDEIRENVAELLELNNYRTITAEDGVAGLECVRRCPPDVIICDVKMPRMNGFELLATLQKQEDTRHIPFIFISASAQKSDIVKGSMSGAAAYLTKPFNCQDLILLIEQVSQGSSNSLVNNL